MSTQEVEEKTVLRKGITEADEMVTQVLEILRSLDITIRDLVLNKAIGQLEPPFIMKGAEEKIRDAATELIAEQGYHETAIKDIAKQAGYSAMTIFRIFGQKTNILKSILEENRKEINEHIRENILPLSLEPQEKILKIFDLLFEIFLHEKPAMGKVLLLESRKAGEIGAKLVTPGLNEFTEIIEALLKEGQEGGILRTEFNLRSTREALIRIGENLLLGFLWGQMAGYRADYLEKDAKESLRLFIRGIYSDKRLLAEIQREGENHSG